MDRQFEQYERDVDRELAALAEQLDGPALSAARVDAVKNAVDAEARRLQRRRRRVAALRPWIGAAAALALTVGLNLPFGSATPRILLQSAGNPELAFNDWVNALDESGQQFTSLLGDDWLLETTGTGENGGNGDPLDSLEESLESFERIIGA